MSRVSTAHQRIGKHALRYASSIDCSRNSGLRGASVITASIKEPDTQTVVEDDVYARSGLSESDARRLEALLQADETTLPERAQEDTSTSEQTGGLSGSIKGMVLLNLGALLFGSNQVVIKTTEEVLSPFALDALRFGLAALCFAPLLPRAAKDGKLVRAALELGAWLTCGYTCQAIGLSMTSASHGAFTGTFTVLAVPILVGLSGRKIAGRTWVAGAAALLGVSLLTTSEGDPNLGDAVCIMSAILFGVHKWRSESVTAGISNTKGLVAMQLAVLAGASIALCVPEMYQYWGTSSPAEAWQAFAGLPWVELMFMGVGTTALTLWIEMDALKEVSAPLAAMIYTAEPLWGAAFAWVLLNERWGFQGWVGAVLIVAASLASQLGGDLAEKAKAVKLD